MKRLLCLLIISVILLAGCSRDALTGYTEALHKTGSIPRGRLKVETVVDMDFNLDNLTVEEINAVRYLEHMDYICEITYDDSKDPKEALAKAYGNVGGLGMDGTVYIKGDRVDLYLPMLGGYLDLSKPELKEKLVAGEDFTKLFRPVINKFLELLSAKDIIKGKRTYITTGDGQIKTTVYTVQMNEEQLLSLVEEVARIMETENINVGDLIGVNIEIDDVTEAMRDWKEHFSLSGFTSTAYVDFDGRLVMQDFELDISLKDANTTKGPVRIRTSGKVTFSGLGEAQRIDIPEVTPDMYLEEGWEELWN